VKSRPPRHSTSEHGDADLALYWLPLGAGGARLVRASGRLYEVRAAKREGRCPAALYHSALRARLGSVSYVIEVAPAWDRREADRGVAASGPVGLAVLGRSDWFRYEVRCWRGGTIPDEKYSVASPVHISTDAARVQRLLDAVGTVPTPIWGRDELATGEMWNSNSVIAWLLLQSGHDLTAAPLGGRAPGWAAGVELARRTSCHVRSYTGVPSGERYR
jgi:hypothetical protein